VKLGLPILVILCFSAPVCAEECVEHAENVEGKIAKFATCTAQVEEAIRANVDGYVMVAYVVKLKDQRIVVADPLGETEYGVGATISYQLMKFDPPSDTRRRFLPNLYATVINPKLSKGNP
jgi:hypothetical protein